jgi:hypothetical protein
VTSERLAVATECPSCGAPLDFGEGSNAISCGHCRTNLLVTGRKRVLSYWIRPRVGAPAARRAAAAGASLGEPRLWFVPYCRVTAVEIAIELALPPPTAQNQSPNSIDLPLEASPRKRVFRDRHLEKNFLALDQSTLAPYSIGVRAAVLKLELFRRAAMEELGTIVAPTLDRVKALEIGTRSLARSRIVQREVLAVRLSLVYFPFWTVEIDRGGRVAVVDGVTGALAERDVEPPFKDEGTSPAGEPETVGFRPLLCPNCGWDLPLRPDDCVFCCQSCRRAWEIEATNFRDVRTHVAVVAPPRSRNVERRSLPFWRLGAARLVPAFRFRRLKSLVDLASSYGERPPTIELDQGERPELVGAYFDQDDAVKIASFVGDRDSEAPEELVWIPYASDGYSLVDPFFGLGLAKNLFL